MTAEKVLTEVNGYMEFWGWSIGGKPGATKIDESGNIIARHGDDVWIADMLKATDALKSISDQTRRYRTSNTRLNDASN